MRPSLKATEYLAPSPAWARAMPPGPDARVKITEPYARIVAREAYFWAWPMINIYNKRLAFGKAPEPGLLDGILPWARVNRLAILQDYIDPGERAVACPNQDVAYGGGPLALDVSPVVIQVPDFGDRFWVYQIVDLRAGSFAVQHGANRHPVALEFGTPTRCEAAPHHARNRHLITL